MKKTVAFVVLFLGWMVLLLIVPASNQTINVYVGIVNIWEKAFPEPFEILYVHCEDGVTFMISTHHEKVVLVSSVWVHDFLKSRGYELEGVVEMVHNHFGYPFMSEGNKRFLQQVRRLGFQGTFSMIDTASGRMVCIRNDDTVVRYRR